MNEARGEYEVRGEYKVPGGKLVAVTVRFDGGGAVTSCRLDGDFFVEATSDAAADAMMRDVERALASGGSVEAAIARHPDATFVGADAQAIREAFSRATDRRRSGRRETTTEADGTSEACASAEGRTAVGDAEDADFAARWARLWPQLAVVHDVPRSPAEQMRVDEAWARDVAAGRRPPTLRVWEWAGPCVVVGRFQSVPDEVHEDVARAEGFDVVRRCTGGGAMFIEPDNTITYSLYAPLWFVDGIDVAASYRLCDRWLVGALRGLGLDVRFAGLNDIASQYGKIGGAAQRRFPAPPAAAPPIAVPAAAALAEPETSDDAVGRRGPGAVLHHVTMAYDIDAVRMARVLNTSREKMSDKAVRSAVKRVDPLRSQTGMGRDEVIGHLLAYARERVLG
ncbi:lipoate--protein ligase family protein [Bifidobacterium saguinibicoloris]|uniref:lipoate--protein ligase family protein n=1 Tax=Bifidobacterium saguinibicoloris TaxID=2834433 RepID=UPI001C562FD0|nr:lipoate--protein ligase family protein [Bifidobacterium saguinibicoloris]MBW3081206.1 lipoate--protein ligase family protein [Bifidobacterium saguinibicoloris]